MKRRYYTQHRVRVARRPEHRVRIFLRGFGLVLTLHLDVSTGEVLADLVRGIPELEVLVLSDIWAWAESAMPKTGGA